MWFNGLMKSILRSPLHRLVSGSTFLITYTGRKSGRVFSVPVDYLAADGEYLTLSLRERTWWKNLRGGSQVKLLLQGKEIIAHAVVEEHKDAVADLIGKMLAIQPGYARWLNVGRDASGAPLAGDLARAAQTRVIVRISLRSQG